MSGRTGEYLTNRDTDDQTPALPPGRAPTGVSVTISAPLTDEQAEAWRRLMPDMPGRPTEAQLAAWARLTEAATEGPWYTVDPIWLAPGLGTYVVAGHHDPHVGTPVLDHIEIEEWDAADDGPDYSQSWADLEFAAAARTAMPRLLAYVASLRETLAFTLAERQEWRRRAEDRAVAHRADIDRLVALEAEAARLRALDPLARAALTYLGTFDEVVEEQISVNHLAVAGGRSRDTDRRMTARHEQVFALRAVLRDAIAALTPEQRAELEASDGG